MTLSNICIELNLPIANAVSILGSESGQMSSHTYMFLNDDETPRVRVYSINVSIPS